MLAKKRQKKDVNTQPGLSLMLLIQVTCMMKYIVYHLFKKIILQVHIQVWHIKTCWARFEVF